MDQLPPIQDFDDPTFDPFVSDELAFGDNLDPYSLIDELRAKAPVHALDYRVAMGLYPDITLAHLQHFSVVGYDEIQHVLGDPLTYSNSGYIFNLGLSFGQSITTMDAPDHPRFRRIFQKAFLPNIVARWGETLVDPVVADLMAPLITRGHADLVQEFTLRYPFGVIYRQLDMPHTDAPIFQKLALGQTVMMFDVEHGVEAGRKLGQYLKALIDARRSNPGNDLVSLLAQAEVDGEFLPEEILVSFLRQLLNAGGDTTYRGTSILLTGLLQHPDQLEAVRQDRSLIPQAIEEALRWDGPVAMLTRVTTRDVVLGGVAVPAGAALDVITASANRDPQRFSDPHQFNIFRERQNRHLSFAAGPHICIGQHLARIEMTRAMNALLDRLPNLRLDPERPAPEVRGAMMRVPKHLFVRFG